MRRPTRYKNNDTLAMKPDVLRFAIIYLGLTLAAALIEAAAQTGAGLVLNLGATAGAAMRAGDRFFRVYRRAPFRAEAGAFARQALLAVWAVWLLLGLPAIVFLFSLADMGGMVADLLRPLVLFYIVLGAAGMSALYYLAIRWPYQWYGNLLERRHLPASRG